MSSPWSLGDEYRAERILELEQLRDEILTLPHAPACPGAHNGCWCPIHDVLALVDDRVLELQPDRWDQ